MARITSAPHVIVDMGDAEKAFAVLEGAGYVPLIPDDVKLMAVPETRWCKWPRVISLDKAMALPPVEPYNLFEVRAA